MTDYRSLERLSVYKDDVYVADLFRKPKGCLFQYTDGYLASGQGAIAAHLPLGRDGLLAEGIANLPTYFAGLLPEGVMFQAIQRAIGSAADDLFAMLAATGSDPIGDIEVRVPGETTPGRGLSLADAAEQMKRLLGGAGRADISRLAALSGVQPKLSLGQIVRAGRGDSFIAKFEPAEFPGLLGNEFDFLRLAKRCSLQVSSARLMPDALVITRFDRESSKGAVKKLHVEDMLQVMDLYPNSKYSMDYAELMRAMEGLGVSNASLLGALRLFVFSYIIGNGDLHAKNVSVIFDKQRRQWQLSPAYDLLSTLPYRDQLSGADFMALALENEAFGRFTTDEFVEFGGLFSLPAKAVANMVERTSGLVLRWLDGTVTHIDHESLNTIRERAISLC